jgi:hypothetical protein
VTVAPVLGPFVDAERAVVLLLEPLAVGNTDIDTPDDLAAHLPFVKVYRIGGQGDRWNDAPRIDVDVFAARGSRTTALDLIRQCQATLLSFPHLIDDVGVIDRVDVDVTPNEVPWQNTDIVRFTSSYKVTVRR